MTADADAREIVEDFDFYAACPECHADDSHPEHARLQVRIEKLILAAEARGVRYGLSIAISQLSPEGPCKPCDDAIARLRALDAERVAKEMPDPILAAEARMRERAAKVAEGHGHIPPFDRKDELDRIASYSTKTCQMISAAIRALVPGEGTT